MDEILGLTGIAAFITLLGVIFQHILASNNKNVIEERCKWRKRLKEIAITIENGEDAEVKKAITELKTRINSFGYEADQSILVDSHFWRIIKNDKVGKAEKNKLVLYIALLLKHDWERCKREVKHWGIIPFEMVGFVCLIGIFAYMVQTQDYSNILQDIITIISLIIIIVEIYFKIKKERLNLKYKKCVEHVENE